MGCEKGLGVLLVSFGVVAIVACGSNAEGTAGESPANEPSGSGGFSTPFDSGGDDADLGACATDQQKAERLPLDLYVLLDTSDSMSNQVSQSVSKDKAVKDALKAFVADPSSAGMGIGLQFFPLPAGGAPATCTNSAQCPGSTGPCSLKVCAQPGPLAFCNVDDDCGAYTCVSVGRCQNARNVYCALGTQCGNDQNGFDRGPCLAQSAGYCGNRPDSCTSADYATPAVPIALLPGSAGPITAALDAKEPQGDTPTSAALKGAVEGARSYAQAHAGHTVVAVLATDGLPTRCDPNVANIAAIAASGTSGTPAIQTFVIGVFAADEAANAKTNLDQIASAGGTTQAFLVTTGTTTTAQFVAAMNAIRDRALPCEYAIPTPEAGTIDYGKINVQHTATSGAKTIVPNKPNASACDAAGGWYYDVDPATGAPSKLVFCPSTCSAVKAAGGQVDVLVGCRTRVN